MQLDDMDTRLIARLRENARAPVAELARGLGLSRTTVQSRLERLERGGVITGYTVRLSDAHERGQIHAYVMLTVAPKQARAVIAAARRMPAVRLLAPGSGPLDLIAEGAAPRAAAMDARVHAPGALDRPGRTTRFVRAAPQASRLGM